MDCRKNKAPRPLHQPPKIPLRTTPGERERVATLSHPVPRGDVGEQSAPRPRRRKQNFRLNSRGRMRANVQETPPIRPVENKLPRQNIPRESARGSQPSRAPVPRGGVGERSAPRPAPSETRLPFEPPRKNAHQCSRNAAHPSRQKPTFPPEHPPGERERVATLSHPVPRGGVGERSAPRPAPSETRLPFEPPRKNIRRCSRSTAHPSRQKPTSPPEQPPGERERVATLSHPRSPRGCRGVESPTPAPSETRILKRTAPAPSETNFPTRTAPGELERV